MRKLAKFTFIGGLATAFAVLQPAVSQAAVVVIGSGLAELCYRAARDVSMGFEPLLIDVTGTRVEGDPVDICRMAIEKEELPAHDLAGTYNNRGVLLFTRGDHEEALRNFDLAIRYDDSIGEAHVNRGASLVALKRWKESIPALDKGLELGAVEPEKAYYNRAIADEELGDIRSAYFDYMKAVELKPDWSPPQEQLKRFTVRQRTNTPS